MATTHRITDLVELAPHARAVELMREPVLATPTARVVSRALPWMVALRREDTSPLFWAPSRPTEATSTLVTDVDGQEWAPVLYWLERADPLPRFNQTGLTVDLQPLINQGEFPPPPRAFLPVEGFTATMTGAADGKVRTMTPSWRANALGRHVLTVTYDFVNDNDRENVRNAILISGLTITVSWTHRARHRPPQQATIVDSVVDAEVIEAIDPRVIAGAERIERLREHVDRRRFPPHVVFEPEPLEPLPPRPRPPRPRPPRPQPQPQPAPEITAYTFGQSKAYTLIYSAAHSMWQDGPSPWKWFQASSGRKMYYRATGRPAEYECLPSEFRLGFDQGTAVPALLPYVYNPKTPDGQTLENERRVKLGMKATPHVSASDREELRRWIAQQESVELAYLVRPEVQGRFELDVPLQGAGNGSEAETVALSRDFWISFDFAVESWAPNLEQLARPGGGVVGTIFLDILPQTEGTEGTDVSVPVALRLTELHADVVEVRPKDPDDDGIPRRFVLRNAVQLPVIMPAPKIFLAEQSAEAAFPTRVKEGRPIDWTDALQPGEEREVVVEPIGGDHVWNKLVVELANPDVDAPTDGWIEAINVTAADGRAAYPVKVRAVNLADETALPQYDSTLVSLQTLRGGVAEPPDGRLERGAREWSTRMWLGLAELWALFKDPARAKLHVVELRSDYADLTGLPQRLYGSASNVTVRALTTERPDSRYELRSEDDVVLATDLDRATCQARIEARRAEGLGWTLRVIPPVTEPTGPQGNTEPVVTDPPPDPVGPTPRPAGPPITVNPVALDFAAVPKVFVTLKIGTGADTLSHTMVFEASARESQVWAPPREPGTPVAYTIVYLLAEGPPRTVSGVETSDLVMVLPPDP